METWKKVVAIIACVAVLFSAGYALGMSKNVGIDNNLVQQNSVEVQTAPPVTVPAVVPAETTVALTTPATSDNTAPAPVDTTAAAETQAPASSNGEIVAKVVEAMNGLKSEQNMKAVKTEKTVINITNCSVNSLTNLLNSICQKVAGEKTTTYDFVNGSAVGIKDDGKEANDGNPQSPKEALPPKGEDFKLTEAGVKDAKAETSGDSTTYTVTLVAEDSTLESIPQVNKDAIGFLNLGSFEIPTVTITQADIAYPETVITVTVNGQGKVTAFKYDQPMNGTMGMKIAIAPGSCDFDGGNYESWEFTY